MSPSERPPEATAKGNRLIPSLRACQQTLARLDPRQIEVEESAIALNGSRRGSTPGLPETHVKDDVFEIGPPGDGFEPRAFGLRPLS